MSKDGLIHFKLLAESQRYQLVQKGSHEYR